MVLGKNPNGSRRWHLVHGSWPKAHWRRSYNLGLTWVIHLVSHSKKAVYCSDVSGAFDGVRLEWLVSKLRNNGIHPHIVAGLASWLQQRLAQAVVGGASSRMMALMNMVYRGTVSGPNLWNLFFEDARHAVNGISFMWIVLLC